MTKENKTQTENSGGAKEVMLSLHDCCGKVVTRSLAGDNAADVSRSYLIASDLDIWNQILANRTESRLYAAAENEFVISLMNLCQGQYRNAFKGLRLVLELCLQGVYLSTNLLMLDEWLRNAIGTTWSILVDKDEGLFSKRFCTAFFPEISEHVYNFNAVAQSLYRELSECVHGNVPFYIPLPTTIELDVKTFNLWHKKAETVRLVSQFAMSMRYLKGLSEEDRAKLEMPLNDALGHIEPIRALLGGPRS